MVGSFKSIPVTLAALMGGSMAVRSIWQSYTLNPEINNIAEPKVYFNYFTEYLEEDAILEFKGTIIVDFSATTQPTDTDEIRVCMAYRPEDSTEPTKFEQVKFVTPFNDLTAMTILYDNENTDPQANCRKTSTNTEKATTTVTGWYVVASEYNEKTKKLYLDVARPKELEGDDHIDLELDKKYVFSMGLGVFPTSETVAASANEDVANFKHDFVAGTYQTITLLNNAKFMQMGLAAVSATTLMALTLF